MTQDEREALEILAIGHFRKLKPAEQERLAELLGWYKQGGKGPPPKDKRHLERITSSDFRTPAAYKKLEDRVLIKILGRTSHLVPCWKEGCPKGTIRKVDIQERKFDRAKSWLKSLLIDATPSMQAINSLTKDFPDGLIGDELEKAMHCEHMKIVRDIRDGRNEALADIASSRELYDKLQPVVLQDIADSLATILKKHTPPETPSQ